MLNWILNNRQPTLTLKMDFITQFGYAKLTVCLVGLIGVVVGPVEAGSCREATLCCNGRDSSCVVQKAPINAPITGEDTNDKPCYCDHACLKLGDCCADFKQHCGGEFWIDFFLL